MSEMSIMYSTYQIKLLEASFWVLWILWNSFQGQYVEKSRHFWIKTQFLLLLWVTIWWLQSKYGNKLWFNWSLCIQFVIQRHKGYLLRFYWPFETHFRANKWLPLRSILVNLVQFGFWPFSLLDLGKHPLFWPFPTLPDLGDLPVLISCLG